MSRDTFRVLVVVLLFAQALYLLLLLAQVGDIQTQLSNLVAGR